MQKKAAKKAANVSEKDFLRAVGKTKHKQHKEKAYGQLRNAEKFAEGKEKIAIQLELAERYRDDGDCGKAILYYNLVAEDTGQEHLKKRARNEAELCR